MNFWNIKARHCYIKDDVSINRSKGVRFGLNLRKSKCDFHFEQDK